MGLRRPMATMTLRSGYNDVVRNWALDTAITADGSSSTTIVVQAMDEYDHELTEGGDLVCLYTTAGTLSGAQGDCEAGEIEATDNDDGTYAAVLTSSTSATEAAIVTGYINGEPIDDDAQVAFVTGDPDSLVKVSGDGQEGVARTALSQALVV